MIVGSAEILVQAIPGSFTSQLTKIAEKGAVTAGRAAGRTFMAEFVASAGRTGKGAFSAALAGVTEKGSVTAGRTAGKSFMTEFVATSAKTGRAGLTTALTANAEKGAVTAGRTSGRTFMAEFIATTSKTGKLPLAATFAKTNALAAEAGAKSGATYSRAFAESSKVGAAAATTTTLGGAAATGRARASGVATGRAYSRGVATGSREGNAARLFENSFRAAEVGAAGSGRRAATGFVSSFGRGLGPLAAIIGAAYSVKLAGDFEQDTNILVTAAGELQSNLAGIRKDILQISQDTGTGVKSLTDAAYAAEKAGYRGSEVSKIVKASAQASREEGAKLDTVTAGLTTTLAAYNLNAEDSVRVTNALKTGAGNSKTTFEGFTSGLGSFLSRASAAKIGLEDVLGVYASITQQGVPVRQAAANLGTTIKALSGPTKVATDLMGQLGINSVDLVQKLGDGPGGRGLSGTLNYLSETVLKRLGPSGTGLLNVFNSSRQAAQAAEIQYSKLSPPVQKLAKQFKDGDISVYAYNKSLRAVGGEQGVLGKQFLTTYTNAHGFQQALKNGGPLAQTYLQQLSKLTGGQQGLSVALAATAGNYEETAARSKAIGDSYHHNTTEVEGWASTQKLFNVSLDRFKQTLIVTGIQIGTVLLPPLQKVFGYLADHPGVIKGAVAAFGLLAASWAVLKIASLIDNLGLLAARLRGVGRASTIAAAETRAANLGSAVGTGTAGAAGAAGAARVGLASRVAGTAVRAVIPLIITYAALKGTGTYDSLSDLLHGDFQKFADDAPKVLGGNPLELGIKIRGIFDKDFAKGITGSLDPAFAITQGQKGLEKQAADLRTKIYKAFSTGGDTTGLEKQLQSLQTRIAGLNKTADDKRVSSYLKGLQGSKGIFDNVFGQKADPKDSPQTQYLKSLQAEKQSKLFHDSLDPAGAQAAYEKSTAAAKTYQTGLADLASQVSTTNHSLTGTTSAAAGNRQALSDLVTKADESAHAYAKNTGVSQDYYRVLGLALPQIQAQAQALGFNKSQVDALITSLGLIPPSKSTKVDVTVTGKEDLQATADRIAAIQSKQVYIEADTIHRDIFVANAQGVPSDSRLSNDTRFQASGGYISGPGTGTSDSIPAMLSNGEFVINAKATAANFDLLAAINGGTGTGSRGMAAGGLVAGTLLTQQQSVAAYLKGLAKEQAQATAAFLKSQAQIAKIGVTQVEKTVVASVKAGEKAVAAAVKDGNGPLQQALSGRLRAAQGVLYARGIAAVQDKQVSPAEMAGITASAKVVTDLTKQLVKLNTVNQALISKLKDFVSAEQGVRDSIKSAVGEGNTLPDVLGLSGSPAELTTQLSLSAGQVKSFLSKITALKKRGYSNAIVRDVAAQGILTGGMYADMLLTATPAQVKAIDAGASLLDRAQTNAANTITRLTQGKAPGITNGAAVTYIQTAIFQAGANVDAQISKAEKAQRTGAVVRDSGGPLYPGRTIVDNNSGETELVLTGPQSRAYLASQAGRASTQVVQHNNFNGVDLATAQAQSARDLSIALRGATG